MNAIRRDESTDNIHSIFVDQWDWEKIIHKEDRNLDYLKETVRTVYKCLRKTEQYMAIQYDYIDLILQRKFSLSPPRNWRICSRTTHRRNVSIILPRQKVLYVSCRSVTP